MSGYQLKMLSRAKPLLGVTIQSESMLFFALSSSFGEAICCFQIHRIEPQRQRTLGERDSWFITSTLSFTYILR
jgi:hypothetical protein